MKRIAFLTMDQLDEFVCYDHLAVAPLAQLGWEVVQVPWREHNVEWHRFAAVIIRSPWDYQQAPQQFLDVLAQIESSGTMLLNDLATVRWNIHKSYLKELGVRGVSVVPTDWLHGPDVADLRRLVELAETAGIVVKPVIGANADDTFRLCRADDDSIFRRVAQVFQERDLMVQPFLTSVTEVGEYSLIWFDDSCSHTILKTPKQGDFRVQEEHGGVICPVEPEADIMAAAARCIDVLRPRPLYARVDIVRLSDGTPAVIELELIEPSLYLSFHVDAPQRFAAAIDQRLRI